MEKIKVDSAQRFTVNGREPVDIPSSKRNDSSVDVLMCLKGPD